MLLSASVDSRACDLVGCTASECADVETYFGECASAIGDLVVMTSSPKVSVGSRMYGSG